MEEIKAPKKERKFLKAMGDIGLSLLRELILGIGKKIINKVGNKRQGLVIAFILFASVTAIAQYPATGNKMRLGYQTTGDGLVYRGRSSDTVSIKSSGLNNAYFILDTVNNIVYNYIKTKGGWVFNNSDTVIVNNNTDTTSLSNRINLKLNKSDTAAMLTNYTRKGTGATVTSVAMTVPSFLSITGSPITTSGTLAVSLSGNALPLLSGGTGATTAADARTSLGGTTSGISLFTLTNSVSDKFIKVNSNNTITLLSANDTRTAIGAGTGSVTSVGMTVPTFLSVSGSPISTSGSFGVTLSGSPLPVLNGGTGGANEIDARDQLGAACKSCNETLTGNKTFSGTVTLSSVTGTATSVIGRSSSGQVVGVTLGTGLSLASGTLNATSTGTVTNVSAGSTANGLSVATGTTTPVISMALAASSTIGVVSATTQTFSGSKTFEGLIGMQKALQRPVENITGSSASITTSNTWVIVNYAGTVTLTFPSASASTGTEFHIKTVTNNTVISASSNIVPIAGGSASTSILPATAGKYVTLVSDGTNWVIMQSN